MHWHETDIFGIGALFYTRWDTSMNCQISQKNVINKTKKENEENNQHGWYNLSSFFKYLTSCLEYRENCKKGLNWGPP